MAVCLCISESQAGFLWCVVNAGVRECRGMHLFIHKIVQREGSLGL